LAGNPTLDWVARGAVTPISNQGSCGSCYTFSAAAAIEGAYFLKTGNLIKLSKQQLVDCSWAYRNSACDGGYMTNCYEYLMTTKLMSEDEYPYVGRTT
jgi:C1A family cysteine protease